MSVSLVNLSGFQLLILNLNEGNISIVLWRRFPRTNFVCNRTVQSRSYSFSLTWFTANLFIIISSFEQITSSLSKSHLDLCISNTFTQYLVF